jgi:hypothetical protein
MPRRNRHRHRNERPPPNAERLITMLIEWSVTGEPPGELEAMAELLNRRLCQRYGDREYTDDEMLEALEQLGDKPARLDSAMKTIGL